MSRSTQTNRAVEQALHRALYLSLQRMRGRPVGAYIERLRSWERLDRVAFERIVSDMLTQSLRHAHANVPLYSTGPWRERLARGDPLQIQSWPVLERGTVRTEAARLRARRILPGVFHRQSSASTGEPLRVAWNPAAAAWGWANEYRAMIWHGVPPGTRTLLLWGTGHAVQDWVKNCRFYSTLELTPERLEEAAQYLLTEHPGLCQGLPSALTRLARHVRAQHAEAPESLVPYAKLGGEQVYPFQREEVRKHLGARVVETYGCTETGPIAAECPAGSMHIHTENVHLEIFRGDEPAPPGEIGDIVVTSLSNRAMPLIRCRIGDTGRIRPEPCVCGRPHPVLDNLIGRAADVFLATNGAAVHGSILGSSFGSVLVDTPVGAIQQSIFQQVDRHHWKVLIESSDGFDVTVAARLTSFVRTTFGEECEVDIERVPLVPREPSGKFRYYRPNRAETGRTTPS